MKWLHLVLIFLAIIFFDQVTKAWAQWAGWVELNRGISFSWLGGSSPWILGLLIATILLTLTWLIVKQRHSEYAVGLIMLLGAGVSNQLDRVMWGGVQDWILIPGLNLKNNLADWIIAVSLVILMWQALTEHVNSTR